LIPIATYACPMLCCAIQFLVLAFCGRRIAWAWFGVVVFLSALLAPDKEAAVVFAFLGYHPLVKQFFDRSKFAILWKMAYFNASILAAYWLMIHILGLEQLAQENAELGIGGLILLLILGNLTFFLLDRLLLIMAGKRRQ